MRYTEKTNLIYILDVVLFHNMGKLPEDIFSLLEIIFQRIHNSNNCVWGRGDISPMDHTQLQQVKCILLLLSIYFIICFKMVNLETDVRAAVGQDFKMLQEIKHIHFGSFNDNP